MAARLFRRISALGVAVSVLASLAVHPVAAVPPDNDSYTSPTPITSIPAVLSADLTEATSAGDPPGCSAADRTVWYTFVPTVSAVLQTDLTGSPPDALLSIYVDSPWNLVACNDPSLGPRPLEVEAGRTYFFQLATSAGSTSATFALEPGPVPPANDQAEGAIVIPSLPVTISPDTTNATSIGDPALCGASGYKTVWYRYSPSEDESILVSLAPTASGSRVEVWDGPGVTSLGCVDEWTTPMPARFDLTAGHDYYIHFGTGTPDENHRLIVELTTVPANDDRESAALIQGLPYMTTVDLGLATAEPFEPGGCFQGPNVWYAFVPTEDVLVDLGLASSAGPVGADVYRELTGGSLEHLGCASPTDALRFRANAGERYLIRLTSLGAPTVATVSLTEGPEPLAVEFTVDPRGQFDHVSGAATISGTLKCNQTASSAWLYVTLRQRAGRFTVIEGTADQQVTCTTTTEPWIITVYGNNGPFNGGKVSVEYYLAAEAPGDFASATGSATVRLVG